MSYLRRLFSFFDSQFYIYNTQPGLGGAVFDQALKQAAMLTQTDLNCSASSAPAPMLVYDSGFALYLFEKGQEIPRDLAKFVKDGRQYLRGPGRNTCAAWLPFMFPGVRGIPVHCPAATSGTGWHRNSCIKHLLLRKSP